MEILALVKKLRSSKVTKRDLHLKVLHVEIDHHSGGFFAQLNWCLYIFAFSKMHSLTPRVSLVSDNYRNASSPKRDWFTNYFTYQNTTYSEDLNAFSWRKKYITHISELGFSIEPDLTIKQAHDIFFETVIVKTSIQKEADDFVNTYFGDKSILGVHYRGTDKGTEAPRVQYESTRNAICAAIGANPSIAGVYIATDEHTFLEYMQRNFNARTIYSRIDSVRSKDGTAVHLSRSRPANTDIGRDALVNCMILSRCRTLVRCSSFLSAWASVFNPAVNVILLNRPFENKLWYPEREIIKTATFL